MISEYDMLRQLDRLSEESGKKCFEIDKESRKVYDAESKKYLCTIDELLVEFRKKLHCDFECIYSNHGSLTTVLRCKECGCVIFGGDDERYDPDLRCPVCSDYHCFNEYWTAEQIADDVSKQLAIKDLERMEEEQRKYYARVKRRNGKSDNQIWVNECRCGNYLLKFELKCYNFFAPKHRLKGLHFVTNIYRREDEISYIYKKHITIPLSIHYAYHICRIRHLDRINKRCN